MDVTEGDDTIQMATRKHKIRMTLSDAKKKTFENLSDFPDILQIKYNVYFNRLKGHTDWMRLRCVDRNVTDNPWENRHTQSSFVRCTWLN